MKIATMSDLRENLKMFLDKVTEEKEIVIIPRSKKNPAVIISHDEYEKLISNQNK